VTGWLGRLVTRGTQAPRDQAAHAGREGRAGDLAGLGMSCRPPGLLRGIGLVARAELRELRSSPGLYLFAPMIVLQVIGVSLTAVGAFGTPLLMTPGTLAVGSMNALTLLVCLLLLFYMVESLQRERRTALAPIYYATPLRSASILFGKVLANSLVGVVILLAALVACLIVLLVQGRVAFDPLPFLLTWGLLLTTTFVGWTAFVTAVLAVTRGRYTTYGLCLGALIITGYRQFTDQMNWVGNWDLWGALRWSDMGVLEMDRTALLLNRLQVVGLAVFFTAVAVRFFPRQDPDAVRTLERLRPWSLLKGGLRLLPFAAAPLALGVALYVQVDQGFQGEAAKKRRKDYWRHNLATWKDAPLPALTAVEIDLELDPARHWFRAGGTYDLLNHHDKDLAQVPLTGGDHWENVRWTMDGQEYEPDNRSRLYVFTPPRPLAPGGRLRVGFSCEGRLPGGGDEERRRYDGVHPAVRRGPDQLHAQLRPGARLPRFGRHRRRQPLRVAGLPRQLLRGHHRAAVRQRHAVHHAGPHHRPRGVHAQLGRQPGERVGGGRPPHRGLGERPADALLQRRRRPLGPAAGQGHGRLLPPRTHLQHRRNLGSPRRRAALLLRVVLPLPVARAEAE
jgi:hypothetical protein